MNATQMVAKELGHDHGGQGSMTMDEYMGCFSRLVDHLRDRARDAIDNSPDDALALRLAQEFCAFTELVNCFGSALIAFEDMEAGDYEDDDEGDGPN